MKENKAPDKLYIDSREHWRKSWTAFTTKAKGDDIEYTRTDAFIEKADEFIGSFFHPDDTELRNCLLKKFHEYMKGE